MITPSKYLAALCVAVSLAYASLVDAAPATGIKNIVLVHGAFVNAAGWEPVYKILVADGYHVTVVQHPLTSFADDIAATKRALATQDGPCVLVGHSYGGAIITEAGADDHVAALVYIAAHAPDQGESESANGKLYPAAAHAPIKSADGFLTLDPARYVIDFAPDMPKAQAEFESHAQGPTNASVFAEVITNPAWKTKPSWYMVAKADRIINPDLERMYAKRANSTTVEIAGASHAVFESHPKEVAALIEDAARHAQSKSS